MKNVCSTFSDRLKLEMGSGELTIIPSLMCIGPCIVVTTEE